MDMTKFTSDQDPDYRNVISELQRLIQPYEPQLEEQMSIATSTSSPSQGHHHHGTRNEGFSAGEPDQATVHEKEHSHRPTKLVNTFSDTIHTNGGKPIQGNEFNSGGGSMNF